MHSVGCVLFCSAYKLASAVTCRASNCESLFISSAASSSLLMTDSKVGIDESLSANNKF